MKKKDIKFKPSNVVKQYGKYMHGTDTPELKQLIEYFGSDKQLWGAQDEPKKTKKPNKHQKKIINTLQGVIDEVEEVRGEIDELLDRVIEICDEIEADDRDKIAQDEAKLVQNIHILMKKFLDLFTEAHGNLSLDE